jgi:hypothetical protein
LSCFGADNAEASLRCGNYRGLRYNASCHRCLEKTIASAIMHFSGYSSWLLALVEPGKSRPLANGLAKYPRIHLASVADTFEAMRGSDETLADILGSAKLATERWRALGKFWRRLQGHKGAISSNSQGEPGETRRGRQ